MASSSADPGEYVCNKTGMKHRFMYENFCDQGNHAFMWCPYDKLPLCSIPVDDDEEVQLSNDSRTSKSAKNRSRSKKHSKRRRPSVESAPSPDARKKTSKRGKHDASEPDDESDEQSSSPSPEKVAKRKKNRSSRSREEPASEDDAPGGITTFNTHALAASKHRTAMAEGNRVNKKPKSVKVRCVLFGCFVKQKKNAFGLAPKTFRDVVQDAQPTFGMEVATLFQDEKHFVAKMLDGCKVGAGLDINYWSMVLPPTCKGKNEAAVWTFDRMPLETFTHPTTLFNVQSALHKADSAGNLPAQMEVNLVQMVPWAIRKKQLRDLGRDVSESEEDDVPPPPPPTTTHKRKQQKKAAETTSSARAKGKTTKAGSAAGPYNLFLPPPNDGGVQVKIEGAKKKPARKGTSSAKAGGVAAALVHRGKTKASDAKASDTGPKQAAKGGKTKPAPKQVVRPPSEHGESDNGVDDAEADGEADADEEEDDQDDDGGNGDDNEQSAEDPFDSDKEGAAEPETGDGVVDANVEEEGQDREQDADEEGEGVAQPEGRAKRSRNPSAKARAAEQSK